MSSRVFGLIGIVSVMIGSWAVAYEVVRKFTGISHSVSIAWGGEGKTEKTANYLTWEAKRNFWMWLGLALITIGSILQATALFLEP